eukprot:10081879-Alexandrium_andersonii.AAC.1
MTIKPDKRLGETEVHDVRLMSTSDRHRLAMRMLQRITFRQRKAEIDIKGHQRVAHGVLVPDGFFRDDDICLEQ